MQSYALSEDGLTAQTPALIKPLAAESLLLGADLAGRRVVVVGWRGHILLSDDEGESWRQVPVPHNALLTAVDFLDMRWGLAVGHDGVILLSDSRGETWDLVHFNPQIKTQNAFMDVLFLDRRVALAVGTYGLAMRSLDGGRSWESFELAPPNEYGESVHLNGLVYDGSETILVPAEFGEIYVSTDRGRRFEAIYDSPYDGSFFGGLALGKEDFLIYGLEGMMFRSQDAGESWMELESGVSVSLQGAARRGTDVVIVGLGGAMAVSRDGGASFTTVIREDRNSLANALFTQTGRLLLFGSAGAVKADSLPAAMR